MHVRPCPAARRLLHPPKAAYGSQTWLASGGRDAFIDFISCSPSRQIVAEGREDHALLGRRIATDARPSIADDIRVLWPPLKPALRTVVKAKPKADRALENIPRIASAVLQPARIEPIVNGSADRPRNRNGIRTRRGAAGGGGVCTGVVIGAGSVSVLQPELGASGEPYPKFVARGEPDT